MRILRKTARYQPPGSRLGSLMRRLMHHRPQVILMGRVGLSMIFCAHLIGALLFSSGRNELLELQAPPPFAYLTFFPIEGSMGFYKIAGKDGFLVYKIYTEQGGVVESAFPHKQDTPRLRYDRLAVLAHHLSENNPAFHYLFLNYLVQQLPGTPVKLKLYAAKWRWENGSVPDTEGKHSGMMMLRDLGEYDGLRNSWAPTQVKRK